MRYVSTRGSAPEVGFGDVLLSGLAPDGGLYVPQRWPELGDTTELKGLTYARAAARIMWPFVEGEVDREVFEAIVTDAYSTFEDPRICPVVSIGRTGSGAPHHLLELFHGPTLAFKDVALQLVGRLFDHFLAERNQRVTILGATSGDTGSAAINAVMDRDSIDVFILFPNGRVSDVQRRQMTTVASDNVHAVAVEGTFDDCQDLVKAAFADVGFREEVGLSAVNSINWARVMAQIVYYVTASIEVGGGEEPVSFCVPTGNFGNVLAGWIAKRMGAPIDRLIIASNSNDILTRFFTTGTMEIREVVPTSSPSMDIQISSNLERLLYEVMGRDGAAVAEMMTDFRGTGVTSVPGPVLDVLRAGFDARRVEEDQVLETIRAIHDSSGMVIDPHTAVAVAAGTAVPGSPEVPVVSLATADPAKFPDAVERALGTRPEVPGRIAGIFDLPERMSELPDDLGAVEEFIRRRRRAD